MRLVEAFGFGNFTFDPETWFPARIGNMELTADAYYERDGVQRYIEIDRASEHKKVIVEKLQRYHKICYEEWDKNRHGKTWPTVIWVVYTRERQDDIRKWIKEQPDPALFVCWLIDEVAERI